MLIKNTKAIFDLATKENVDLGVAKSMFIEISGAAVTQADSDAFDRFVYPKSGKYAALAKAYREKDDAAFQAIVDEAVGKANE